MVVVVVRDLASVDWDGGGWVGIGLVLGASRFILLLLRREEGSARRARTTPLCCIGSSGLEN